MEVAMRVIALAIVTFAVAQYGFAQEVGHLSANDVTWLWPVPSSREEADEVISIGSLRGEDGDLVWSDQQFEDILSAADSEAARVEDSRIILPDAVRDKSVWKVVAMRIDASAPGGHEIIRKTFGEAPQIRLVLQPVTLVDGEPVIHDIAVHVVYAFVIKGEGAAPDAPDKVHFKKILEGLDGLKELSRSGGVETGGPLGVHPGLKSSVPGLRDAVAEFLSTHLKASRLTAMAIMGLEEPEPWIFLALTQLPGTERFTPIPAFPAQMLSFSSGKGRVSPTPRTNNLNQVPNGVFMPGEAQARRGVATAPLFEEEEFDATAFARVSENEVGEAVLDESVRLSDVPDIIANPITTHFFNADCVSCHTEARRRIRFNLPTSSFAYLEGGRVPEIDRDVLPTHDWNVRNLGWFPPSEFIGGGPALPTITQRTANETAEVVAYIKANYTPREGSASERKAERTDGTTSPDERATKGEVTFLQQGWTANERQDFYFMGQGSQLLPYAWFLCLEQVGSEELLRSDGYLRRLGFIPQSSSEPRNPDGLPIGIVRDSTPSTAAMKEGFLGPDYELNYYPTNEWVGLTCAACHTSEINNNGKQIRVDGGAALVDIESFLDGIAKSLRATVDDDEKFQRFALRIRDRSDGDIDTSGLRDELRAYAPVIEHLVVRNRADHPYGIGRLDAFGAILNQICEVALEIPANHSQSNAPVSFPFLWDAPRLDWVQWNSSVDIPIARNVGEVLGVFAHVKLAGTPELGQFSSTAKIDYLHRLETLLTRLHSPAWPAKELGEIDRDKAAAGKVLFAKNCAHCHGMQDERGNFEMTEPNAFGRTFIRTTSVPFNVIGTDPQMALNFVRRVVQPGDLREAMKIEGPETQQKLAAVAQLHGAMGWPTPDFSEEVPAGMLLGAAVAGVIEQELQSALAGRSEAEKQDIVLNLRGYRTGATPPNGGAGYKARPLNGVWATAPFGHAGSVPNLYQWLLPEDQRDTSFHVGNREFDPVHVGYRTEGVADAFYFRVIDGDGSVIPGNSNRGHSGPGKTDFTESERWALIEYLKSI